MTRRWRSSEMNPERWISVGTVAGSAANLIALPLTARIYGAEQFGVAGLIIAVSSVVQPFIDMGTSAEISVSPSSALRSLARRVARLLAGLAVIALLIGLSPSGIPGVPLVGVGDWLLLVLLVAATALFNLAIGICSRTGRVMGVGKGRAIRGIVGASAAVVLGVLSPEAASLVLSTAVGLLAGAWAALVGLQGRIAEVIQGRGIEAGPTSLPLRRASFSAGGESLRALALQTPIIVAGLAYPTSTVGQLVLAIRVASLPGSVIGVAATIVSQSKIAKLVRSDRPGLRETVLGAIRKTAIPAAIFFLFTGITVALTGDVAVVVLGPSFEGVGLLYLMLIPGYAAQAIALPTARVLLLMGRQRYSFLLLTWRFVAGASACLMAIWVGASATQYAASYSFALLLAVSLTSTMVLRETSRWDEQR